MRFEYFIVFPFGTHAFAIGFKWVSCCSILVFYLVLYIIVCPFALFLLAVVLSILLRFTVSDYP